MGIYNCSKTLDASILSIINQTYPNWEFIICDDGSSDDSYQVAKKYERKDPRIKVIKNNTNLGLAASLNNCFAVSTGDYVARQDGDDVSEPDKLEKQLDFLEQNSEFAMVGTWMNVFDEQGEWGLVRTKAQPNKIDFIFGSPFCHATMMIRRHDLEKVNAYRVSKHTMRCEDYDLWMRMYAVDLKGYNIAAPLYKVRIDHHTFTRRKFKDRLFSMCVGWKGYRLMRMPFYLYPFLFRSVLGGVVPQGIQTLYQQMKLRRR